MLEEPRPNKSWFLLVHEFFMFLSQTHRQVIFKFKLIMHIQWFYKITRLCLNALWKNQGVAKSKFSHSIPDSCLWKSHECYQDHKHRLLHFVWTGELADRKQLNTMDEVTKKLKGKKNHSRNCLILHIRTLTFHRHVRKIYFNSLLIQKGVTFTYYNLGLLTKLGSGQGNKVWEPIYIIGIHNMGTNNY